MEPRSDEELLEQQEEVATRKHKRELLDHLFARYQERIALWCFRLTGARQSAADLAQEILILAYRSLDSLRGDAKFSTWLSAITRNYCWNYVHRRATRWDNVAEPLSDDTPDEHRLDLCLEWSDEVQQIRKMWNEIFVQRIVNTVLVVVAHVFMKQPEKMSFVPSNDIVRHFSDRR